ncbi:hypothetical protein JJV70_02100 [Streptomyces sp. JJ66]|uniref:hypothetical protein n=1 Tax=Streptomyces sp. JJ66 TaxID=2803843 RepID=UPI001C58F74A|nr:hypothetical protein [Streptomyces sp. JJ66]MBW1600913.1 hypothetical protein [Streptomyces sp. JJ66]
MPTAHAPGHTAREQDFAVVAAVIARWITTPQWDADRMRLYEKAALNPRRLGALITEANFDGLVGGWELELPRPEHIAPFISEAPRAWECRMLLVPHVLKLTGAKPTPS